MAKSIYVAPNGNDLGSGTLDQPFRSIQVGLGQLNDGQGGTLFLRGGSYLLDDAVRISDQEGGLAGTRLVVQNYENEKVLIDGTKLAPRQLSSIVVSSTRGVDIQGLDISGSYGGISVVGDSQDITIRNNVVHDVQFSGIAAFGATQKGIKDIKVENNTVFRTNLFNEQRPIDASNTDGWGSGIVFSRTDGGTITNNTVYNNYGEGIALTLANGAVASKNTVYDNFSVGMYMDNASNSTFESNFIYNTGNQSFYRRFAKGEEAAIGIQLANEFYADKNPLFNNVIRNNVVVGGDRLLGYGDFDRGGGLKNVSIVNNTFYGNSTTSKIVGLDAGSHEGTVLLNNIFFKESPSQQIVLPPDLQGLNFSNNLWFGGSAGAAASASDVTTNPLLAKAGGLAAQDYQILAGSSAIDRGAATNIVPTDFLGGARPINAFDIGAYEFAAVPDALPPISPEQPPVVVTPAPEPLPTPPPVLEQPPIVAPPIVVPPIVIAPEHVTVNIPVESLPKSVREHCPQRFKSLSVNIHSLKSLKDLKNLKDLKDLKDVKVEVHLNK